MHELANYLTTPNHGRIADTIKMFNWLVSEGVQIISIYIICTYVAIASYVVAIASYVAMYIAV